MTRTRACLAALLVAATATVTPTAWADYGRGHYRPYPHHSRHYHPGWGVGAGVVLGSALLWAATRPAPPPVVYSEPLMAPPPPTYYAPRSDGWWYYCPTSDTYYPYAQSCPVSWQRVAPR